MRYGASSVSRRCFYRPENDDGPSLVRVSRDTQLVLPHDIQLRVGSTIGVGAGTSADNTGVGTDNTDNTGQQIQAQGQRQGQ